MFIGLPTSGVWPLAAHFVLTHSTWGTGLKKYDKRQVQVYMAKLGSFHKGRPLLIRKGTFLLLRGDGVHVKDCPVGEDNLVKYE